jgi:hypothetical protein
MPEAFTAERMGAELDALAPSGDHAYLRPAWLACLQFALVNSSIRQRFEQETGLHYHAPTSGIAAAIDKATGYPFEYIVEFAKWMDKSVWGDPDAPIPEDL